MHSACVFVFVQVVLKKETHDYRCLFRVCFMPRVLQLMLQEDPTAFMYLYLQVDDRNCIPVCIVCINCQITTKVYFSALHPLML